MKYILIVNATISLATDVEADSLDEAISIAQDRGVMSLCHQCNGGDPDCEWGTEIDCEVDAVSAELVDVIVDNESIEVTNAVRALWTGSASPTGLEGGR